MFLLIALFLGTLLWFAFPYIIFLLWYFGALKREERKRQERIADYKQTY